MQKWYLMNVNTNPDSFGGFKNNAFLEALKTEIASTAILYNHDLSKQQEIRCIIQGNVSNSRSKSMERTGLFQHGQVKAGMYLFFENRYWLITGYPGTNGIYDKVSMVLCQYRLRWQNSEGTVTERWCNGTCSTKNDGGETGNTMLRLSSNSITLLLPNDEESLDLDGKRVFIDKHSDNPLKVYKIMRCDDILYDYGNEHGGILSFIADKTEFNSETDNQELRICDYRSPVVDSDETPNDFNPVMIRIEGPSKLKIGFPKAYQAIFCDSNKTILTDPSFSWNIDSDFTNSVKQSISDDEIKLSVTDENLIGKSLLLQVIMNSKVLCEKSIAITDIY